MEKDLSNEEERLLELWLSHPGFRAVVEADLGKPFKTVVWVAGGVVKFQGPKGAKALAIAHIIQGARELEALGTESESKVTAADSGDVG